MYRYAECCWLLQSSLNTRCCKRVEEEGSHGEFGTIAGFLLGGGALGAPLEISN